VKEQVTSIGTVATAPLAMSGRLQARVYGSGGLGVCRPTDDQGDTDQDRVD
jgi:hypothetical protein